MLTTAEHDAVTMAGKLYTHIETCVVGHGVTREDDLAEIRALVHRIQHAVMAQAAARLHPQRYRLLGETIERATP